MPITWSPSTAEAHEALPDKHRRKRDPEWDALLDELAKGNTVMVEYHDAQEHNTLARALGRRAANRGFHVELRNGEGYISARRAAEDTTAKLGKSRKVR